MAAQALAFDPDGARQRLATARGPVYWRSLEELADAAGFRNWLRTQHPGLADTLAMDRRGFLKLLGASLALAGLSACSHPPQTEIVPYVDEPAGQIDGLPRYFASVLVRGGYARGVLIKNSMGRPTKIEGNPGHPASLGSTDIFAQAAILQLWDPDRSQSVLHGGDVATWDDFSAALLSLTAGFDRNGGAGLRILTGAITSPTLSAQLDALRKKYPSARWHAYEPSGDANALAGTRLAFGQPLAPRLHFERAKVIVTLDADPFSDPAAGVRYARDFADTRDPDRNHGAMSRLYAIEPTPGITGSMADHHLALESWRIGAFAQALAQRLGVTAYGASGASALPDVRQRRWLDALADDLHANPGASLIAVGHAQPPWLHALAHALNAALGNVGKTLDYSEPVQKLPAGTLADLARAMHAGAVDTLLMLDVNPAYDAPADLRFAAALEKVRHPLHLGLYRNETGARAAWHLPMAHPLEAWADARAFDGTASIAQPGIAPLYDGKSAIEVLALLLGDNVTDGQSLVRRQWRTQLPDDKTWNAALRAGVIANTALPVAAPPHDAAKVAVHGTGSPPIQGTDDAEKLELLFRPDPTIGDGYWANNGWLQELPKPLTQLTWDNAALVSPALAERLHLQNGDMVELQSRDRKLEAAAWILPGQAANSVTLHLGYGRAHAGHVGDGRGFNAYTLRTAGALWAASDLRIHKTGAHFDFAATQHHFNMEGRDIVREATLAEFLAHPDFATINDRYGADPPSLYPDYPPGEYSWGMSIDLNTCIGCKACTIACQAENNIPVVGKDQVRRGREMHWIRVDRYYEGAAEDPRSVSQPVPCMMCEHAPCEVVCPVGATVHDSEGLNVQVYNRCVGTRFCSNNCPYKVRRFNFLQYTDKTTPQLKAMRNPEVSVRRRGVMEKCTYCIQRIETAHIEADKQSRRIRDGEIVTACQAACPTQAIRFGNMADKQSEVSQAKASPRNYALLGELGTRPHTTYLARLRNPNPALKDDEA
jgi:molybdopterin-containing oxidoreductase family iron-sulfur binding subunit